MSIKCDDMGGFDGLKNSKSFTSGHCPCRNESVAVEQDSVKKDEGRTQSVKAL